MEGLLGHVIHSLSASSVYEDGSSVDPHVPAVSLVKDILDLFVSTETVFNL